MVGFKKASTRDEGASKASGFCRGSSIPVDSSRCTRLTYGAGGARVILKNTGRRNLRASG